MKAATYLTIFLLIFSVFIQGCAAPLYMSSMKGTIRVGMTRAEVAAVLGEPLQKDILGEEYVQGICLGTEDRWELWRYPRMTWWAAYGVDLAFNKSGVLTSIEPLMK